MPVYDYQCENCGACFENEHAMSFTGKVKCPACGSTRTIKVFHPAGVHFKGSGFYVTDSSTSRNAATSSSNGDCTADPKPECESCPVKKTKKSGKSKPSAKS